MIQLNKNQLFVKIALLVFVVCVIPDWIQATTVRSCSSGAKAGSDAAELSAAVNITDCDKGPCILRRKTVAKLQFEFTPDRDVNDVISSVNAQIAGIPFPFIGVDGSNVCAKISYPDGSKAGCPLKAGVKYLYRDSFKVLEIYPKLKLVVHWALTNRNKDLFCFEVPAKIL